MLTNSKLNLVLSDSKLTEILPVFVYHQSSHNNTAISFTPALISLTIIFPLPNPDDSFTA